MIRLFSTFLAFSATGSIDYTVLEQHWKLDVEKTLAILDPAQRWNSDSREKFANMLKGTRLIFENGFIERITSNGRRTDPATYSIMPISDTSFEITGKNFIVFMIVIELSPTTLCVRYDTHATSDHASTPAHTECFVPHDEWHLESRSADA